MRNRYKKRYLGIIKPKSGVEVTGGYEKGLIGFTGWHSNKKRSKQV